MTKNSRIIALFDVDGTLTEPREVIKADMIEYLKRLKEKITVGVVGGSDLIKQKEQLGEKVTEEFDYSFSENGLVAFKNGKQINATTIKDFLGNAKINKLVSFILSYIANLDIPIKRGTFVEFRTGMLNVSPIGRNCSREERNEFEKYDEVHQIRKRMVEVLKVQFAEYGLQYSIGGQISFDVFPMGWDKTYCLQFLSPKDYDEIHFFGDKTHEGGNDYEIYINERTHGHSVKSPEDTIRQLNELFF